MDRIGISLFLILGGCTFTPPNDLEVIVTFDKDIKPITSMVCINCHTQKGKNWTVYEDAFKYRRQIYDRVVITKTMPLGTYMDENQRHLFKWWYQEGAKK